MTMIEHSPASRMTGRFAFSSAPIPGESLLGFIARNADIHGVDKIASALLPAGLENPKTDAFATSYERQVDVLASLFMTTPEEVRSRMYLPWAGGDGVDVNFHGTRMRPKYLRWVHRRFSPTSLRISGHHRALWDLLVLSFCPESKEILLSECPHCQRKPAWRYTLGLATCEWCEGDLTDVAGSLVRCDDMEALDFVCDLVNPDPTRRVAALARVPSRLSSLDAGGVFEFVVNLACMLVSKPEASSMVRVANKGDMGVLTPESLAKAGRLILGWPTSMHKLAVELRSQAHLRTGSWGTRRELRPLLWLNQVRTIPSEARDAVSEVIDASVKGSGNVAQRVFNLPDEYLTKYEAATQFGFRNTLLERLCELDLLRNIRRETAGKSTVLIRREDIVDLRTEMGDATPRLNAAGMLGVDYLAVERLADAGLLRRTGRATSFTVFGQSYRTSSITGLEERLLSLARRPARAGSFVTLTHAAASSRAPIVPWTGLVEAVLSRRLPIVMLSKDPELPLMGRLGIRSTTVDMVAGLPQEALPESMSRQIHSFEAGAILEISPCIVTHLTQSGGLSSSGSGQYRLKLDEVLGFRSRGISAREVGRRTGLTSHQASMRLTSLKLPLSFASRNRTVLFWNRAVAEGAFDRVRNA